MTLKRYASLLTPVALGCALALRPGPAHADAMDPAFERLAHDPVNVSTPCADAGRLRPGAGPCVFDSAAFRKLVSQYGFAIAPLSMAPARTTGFGGFQFSLQGAFTNIDSGADYWQNGTQGARDGTSGRAPQRNTDPDPWLQVYSATVRKGLPFGFELAVSLGYMVHTSIISGGADLRWSLLEGFRTGALGVLPDLAIGGGVRTITGTPQVQLTVASADAMLSKPIAIVGSSVLTPYLGYQLLRIFGDSGLIDATPNTDALAACNYQGQNVPFGLPGDTGTSPPYSGQPICSGGSSEDLNNTRVLSKARITRHRIVAGVSYRYEMLLVGAQLATDLVDPEAASGSAPPGSSAPRQSTVAVQLGVAF